MKTYLKPIFYGVFLMVWVTACDASKPGLTKEEAQQTWDGMIKGYIDADTDAILGPYAENAQMFEPGRPILAGKEAILKSTKSLLENVKFLGGSAEVLEVHSDNNLAYDISYFGVTLSMNDTTTVERKWQHIAIWKRQADGAWKISRLLFNEAAIE